MKTQNENDLDQINETENEKKASEAGLNEAIQDNQSPEIGLGFKADEAGGENGELTPDVLALIGVNGAADLATGAYPFLNFSDETRAEGVKKLTPLLEKYNISSPLLNRWKLEIEAGFFFGSLIFKSYIQIDQYKKSEAAKEVKTADTVG